MIKEDEISQALKAKLNREAGKINWQDLQRHYASGAVIAVSSGMDLIEVASQFSEDNHEAVANWLSAGNVYKVEDHQAENWFALQTEFWAVVVAPWVLVQECLNE